MAKRKNAKSTISIKDILKGKFLVDETSVSNWRFLLFLALLGFVVISSSHWVDEKVVEINKLDDEVSTLKSQYTDAHRELMSLQIETEIIRQSEYLGVKLTDNQPYVIVKNK